MAVGFDITDLVRFGQENVVAVRTANDWDCREKATGQKYQWADRNFTRTVTVPCTETSLPPGKTQREYADVSALS